MATLFPVMLSIADDVLDEAAVIESADSRLRALVTQAQRAKSIVQMLHSRRHHECCSSCTLVAVSILYNKSELHIHVESDALRFDCTTARAACDAMRSHLSTQQQNIASPYTKIANTYACTSNGALHVCTGTRCKHYATSGCVGEDGSLACPLTGLVHSRGEWQAKSWQEDVQNLNSSAYCLNGCAGEARAGDEICRASMSRYLDSVKRCVELIDGLLPGGVIHSTLKATMQKCTLKKIHATSARRVRALLRPGGGAFCTLNLTRLRSECYAHAIYAASQEKPWSRLSLTKRQRTNIARMYVHSLLSFFKFLKSKSEDDGGRFHSCFITFAISMLYLSQSDLLKDGVVVLKADDFLAASLPPLTDLIRQSNISPTGVLSQFFLSKRNTGFSHMTKQIYVTKNYLLTVAHLPRVQNFRVNFACALNGLTQLILRAPTGEIKDIQVI